MRCGNMEYVYDSIVTTEVDNCIFSLKWKIFLKAYAISTIYFGSMTHMNFSMQYLNLYLDSLCYCYILTLIP